MGKRRGPRGDKQRVEMRKNRGTRRGAGPAMRHLPTAEAREIEAPLGESIAPKGELSRKRTVDVSRLHWHGTAAELGPDEQVGLVVQMFGAQAEVLTERGAVLCSLRRVLKTVQSAERGAVAVGDRVTFRSAAKADDPSAAEAPARPDLPQGVIERVLPRGGELCRRAKGRWHTLASNVDQLVIITSCAAPPVSPHLVDRYLVAAAAGDLQAHVVLNKVDLVDEATLADVIGELRAIYDPLGVTVQCASVTSGAGVDEFRALLQDRCTAVAGQSGVGKSSLLNAAFPGLDLRVGEVSAWWQRGRHTTTSAVLIRLPGPDAGAWPGSYVIDTPGVRQLALWDLPARDVAAYFPEIAAKAGQCRFADCTHQHATGCAVQAAVDAGDIHPSRFDSYVRLVQESQG